MKTEILFAIFVFSILTYFFLSRTFSKYKILTVQFETPTGNVSVKAEVADNIFKKSKGLMGRECLGENEGMLFVLNIERRPRFWMKNMKFPIDIVYISKEKKVVDIIENAQPCNSILSIGFTPKSAAKYVLEVNAGFIKKYGIKIGDRVIFRSTEKN